MTVWMGRGSGSNPSGRTSLYLGFATYRAGLVLPFVATWTALYYVLGGDCCRSWRPGGSSTLAPP
jgi:hypothetical protein